MAGFENNDKSSPISYKAKRAALFQTSPRPVNWLKFCMFLYPFWAVIGVLTSRGFGVYFDAISGVFGSVPIVQIPYYLSIILLDFIKIAVTIIAAIGIWRLSPVGFSAIRILLILLPSYSLLVNLYEEDRLSIVIGNSVIYAAISILQLLYFEKRRYLFDNTAPYPAENLDGKLISDPSVKTFVLYTTAFMIGLLGFTWVFNWAWFHQSLIFLNTLFIILVLVVIIWFIRRKSSKLSIQKIWNAVSVILIVILAGTAGNFYNQISSMDQETEKEIQQQKQEIVSLEETIAVNSEELKSKISENNTLSERVSDLEDQLYRFGYKAYVLDSAIAFVTNDGMTYHRFDCQFMEDKPYWAYNKELAESMGYTPCSVCFSKDPEVPIL